MAVLCSLRAGIFLSPTNIQVLLLNIILQSNKTLRRHTGLLYIFILTFKDVAIQKFSLDRVAFN